MHLRSLDPGADLQVAEDLLVLQRTAYAVEAQLLGDDRIPNAHRRGVGTALVRRVCLLAGRRSIVVSTGRDNVPARHLYESLGFEPIKDIEVLPRLWVTQYLLPGSVIACR